MEKTLIHRQGICTINKLNSRTGFTLAEVLLVITVIGVIASLTIPTLIRDLNVKQNKIAFKKVYSEMNQATLLIKEESGGTLKGLCKPPFTQCNTAAGRGRAFAQTYAKHLKYVKYCDRGYSEGHCWTVNKLKYLNGTESDTTGASVNAGVVLANGIFVLFGDYWYAGDYGDIWFDVNGFKGPNQYGVDIFGARILEDIMVPRGYPGEWWGCDANHLSYNNYRGIGCAMKVLLDQDYIVK